MTGTWTLVKLILRRERLITPLWMLLLVALSAGQANRYLQNFTTPQAIADFAREMTANKALLAFAGQAASRRWPPR